MEDDCAAVQRPLWQSRSEADRRRSEEQAQPDEESGTRRRDHANADRSRQPQDRWTEWRKCCAVTRTTASIERSGKLLVARNHSPDSDPTTDVIARICAELWQRHCRPGDSPADTLRRSLVRQCVCWAQLEWLELFSTQPSLNAVCLRRHRHMGIQARVA